MIKKLLCLLGFHNYILIGKIQYSKAYYGCGLGTRLKYKCKKCGKIKYLGLNLMVPDKDLYKDYLWWE